MIYAHIILLSDKGKRPLSHRVEVQSIEDYKQNKKAYQDKGVITICVNRHMSIRHLREQGYNNITVKFEIKENI